MNKMSSIGIGIGYPFHWNLVLDQTHDYIVSPKIGLQHCGSTDAHNGNLVLMVSPQPGKFVQQEVVPTSFFHKDNSLMWMVCIGEEVISCPNLMMMPLGAQHVMSAMTKDLMALAVHSFQTLVHCSGPERSVPSVSIPHICHTEVVHTLTPFSSFGSIFCHCSETNPHATAPSLVAGLHPATAASHLPPVCGLSPTCVTCP